MKDKQNVFRCRLCGEVITLTTWGGGECTVCGSVSAKSIPTNTELDQFYRRFNEAYEGGHSGGGNLIRYANRYLSLIQRHVRTGKLIDIGSSTNPFPNIAANAGFSVSIMDYVKPKGIDQNVSFFKGSLNTESFLSAHTEKYDIVTALAVLEHVSDPKLACKILAGSCKPGGTILLSTPEIGTFLTQYSIGRSDWFHPPMHLHLLSPSAIQTIFQQNGCVLLEWGRLELNPWRYIARYGIGITEAAIGITMKQLDLDRWNKLRESRKQKFKGITFFIFKKLPTTSN